MPKPDSEFDGQPIDFVITLRSKARQECANFPDAGQLMAWDFADAKPKEGIAPFEVTLRELNERIKMFASVPTKEEKSSP